MPSRGSCECRSARQRERWRTSGERHRHTARELSLATIQRRYHPFHGEQVQVVRRLRRLATDSIVVRLHDGVQVALPAWMLDPVGCSQLRDAAKPRIATAALLEVRTVLEIDSETRRPHERKDS